jgi:hypothetical protein
MSRSSQFEKFFVDKKNNAAIKEQFKQEKKKEKKERPQQSTNTTTKKESKKPLRVNKLQNLQQHTSPRNTCFKKNRKTRIIYTEGAARNFQC